jgi:4-amino-4-deoxy-L-arabinose transferase-like glycosyltransferase
VRAGLWVRPLWLLASAPLLLWLIVTARDSYFRDELYYVAAGRHLDWGYVDFPAMTALLAAGSRLLFGESLSGLRLIPAVAGSATVVLTALMAREMGGDRLAQLLAALATLVAPVFLATNALFSMDAIDRTFWIAGTYVLTAMLRRREPRLWLAFGAVAGVGLLTKVTMLHFGCAVVIAFLLAGEWRYLVSRWTLAAGAIALAGLTPYLAWQVRHGWPTLEFFANYGAKLAKLSAAEFVLQQVLGMNPATLPIWAVGLYALVITREGRPLRPLGLTFAVLFAVLLVLRAKSYFLAPAYPVLLAAGAVRLARAGPRVRRVIAPYAVLLGVSGLFMAVMAMPVLSPAATARLIGVMGAEAVRQERAAVAELPQYLADRHGWEDMVATVASAYHRLAPEERTQACLFMANYGRAAAIDFYGPRYGLPPAISAHNSYYLWGPRACTGQVVITTGSNERRLRQLFESVERVATVTCAYCLPSENNVSVYVARNMREPMAAAWPRLKLFN